MIPVSTTIACGATLFVSLILPVILMIALGARYRRQGMVLAWLLGAAGFVVPQMLIRLPILNFLSAQSGFVQFSAEHIWLYSLGLAFTAGLFELAGRYAVAKTLQKKMTFRRALAAGLGHGGVEAMIIVGMTYVNNLIYIVMINSGSFDATLAQAAAAGVDVAQLEAIRASFLITPPLMFLLAGVERLLAMTGHLGMSVLVCYGVAHGKTLPAVLLCLGLHTLIDATAGVSLLATAAGGNVLSQGAAYAIIYAVLAVVAALSLLIVKEIRRRWKKEAWNEE